MKLKPSMRADMHIGNTEHGVSMLCTGNRMAKLVFPVNHLGMNLECIAHMIVWHLHIWHLVASFSKGQVKMSQVWSLASVRVNISRPVMQKLIVEFVAVHLFVRTQPAASVSRALAIIIPRHMVPSLMLRYMEGESSQKHPWKCEREEPRR